MTPESKQLNYTSNNTMATRRPQIIRTSNDDLIKDKCALTQLLDALCHDKTTTIGMYHYDSLKCLEEYRTHWDTFVDSIGVAFFYELVIWPKSGKTSMGDFGLILTGVLLILQLKRIFPNPYLPWWTSIRFR